MNVTVEKLTSNKVKMTITIDAETFEKGMAASYRKNVGRLNIPGFRKGKAPRKVVENYYGEAVFYEDAFNTVFPDAYEEALKQEGLEAVDQPEVDIVEIGSGKDNVFTAEVYIRPEVTLGEYKGIHVKKAAWSVSDAEVEAEVTSARERNARYIDVDDRAAQLGDQCTIDYKGTVDGVAFEGGTAEKMPLTLGSNTFIPGFEDGVVGMNIGDEKDIDVTFPEQYGASELAGKAAVFHVKLHEIKVKELPDADDEFAKEVSEFDTLDEYKADLRTHLEEQAKNTAENIRDDELVDKVCANAQVDIPDPMVDRAVDNMLQEMQMRMMYQGMTLDQSLQYTGQTMEQLREGYRGEAERRVRSQLVLEAIEKAEGITAEDAEVDAEVDEYAGQSGSDAEEFKKSLQPSDWEYMKDVVLSRKVLAFLRENMIEDEAEEPAASEPAPEQPAEDKESE